MDAMSQPSAPDADRKITLIELLSYIGTAVALVGTGAVVDTLTDTSKGIQAFVSIVLAAALFAAGVLIGGAAPDRLQRMRSVFWFLSVQSAIQFFGLVLGDIGNDSRLGPFLTLAISCGYAVVLWIVVRRSLQQIAVFGTALGALLVLVFPKSPDFLFGFPDLTGTALVLWIFGGAWYGLGHIGRIRPRRTAMVLGSIAALIGPLFFFSLDHMSLPFFLVLATAIVLLILGTMAEDRAVSGLSIVGLLFGSAAFVGSLQIEGAVGAILTLVIGLIVIGIGLYLARGEGHMKPEMPFGIGGIGGGGTGGGMPAPPPPAQPPQMPSGPEPPGSEPPGSGSGSDPGPTGF